MKTTLLTTTMMIACASVTSAQRVIPPPASGETFAEITEQGPPFELETYVLTRSAAVWGCPEFLNPYGLDEVTRRCFQIGYTRGHDFLWYQYSTGNYWLVVQNPDKPDCIRSGSFAPNLNLSVVDIDQDGQDDILGHNSRTGAVHRYYTRDYGQCSVQNLY